ncbi:MAG: sigma-70 family RNA polymerase sigma factor [Planctomycetes bacterium]|nr:sigma-70 family RNA polymerase sigma factor [Planctomycetota bacterium]
MSSPLVTSWTIIQDASQGQGAAQAEFARRYADVIRAYLAHRWRGQAWIHELEDAVQDVFIECFREGGILDKVDPDRPGGFRAFLFGVVRNVALRVETKSARDRQRHQETLSAVEAEEREASLSKVFDQEWARMVLQEAAELQTKRAEERGADALRRVELLRLRFEENLPIRKIAAQWGEDADDVHRYYRMARNEFRDALKDVLARHHGGSAARIEAEGERLLGLFE